MEGVALGLMAETPPIGTPYWIDIKESNASKEPWTWIAELAVIASGCIWDAQGALIPSSILGGSRFNHEDGRGPFHDRDHQIIGSCLATPTLSHREILLRLQRQNQKLGWDHTTPLSLSWSDVQTPEGRALLWSGLYAGSHVVLADPNPASNFRFFFSRHKPSLTPLGSMGNFWAS